MHVVRADFDLVRRGPVQEPVRRASDQAPVVAGLGTA
jgi:hypothetical protein